MKTGTDPIPEKEQRLEGQELFCHNCQRYVQYADDLAIDGRRDIVCPNCGHHHYRIVRDGKITEDRWGQDPSQQGAIWQIAGASSSVGSFYITYSSSTSGTANSAMFQSRLDLLTGAT